MPHFVSIGNETSEPSSHISQRIPLIGINDTEDFSAGTWRGWGRREHLRGHKEISDDMIGHRGIGDSGICDGGICDCGDGDSQLCGHGASCHGGILRWWSLSIVFCIKVDCQGDIRGD